MNHLEPGGKRTGRPRGPVVAFASLLLAVSVFRPSDSLCATNESHVGELIASIARNRQTTGFRMRATLAQTDREGTKKPSRQIMVTGRVDGKRAQVLYLLLDPVRDGCRAVLIEKSQDSAPAVSLFTAPDSLVGLPSDKLGTRLFDTDFTVEDMVEPFWQWPASAAKGETNLLGHVCTPVEFRDPSRAETASPAVRAWIAADIGLPLLVEVRDSRGDPVRRLHSEKLIRRAGDQWAPMTVISEDIEAGTRTSLFIRGGERDIAIPPEDFTAPGIAGLLAGRQQTGNRAGPSAETKTPTATSNTGDESD
jgi:hypothetical protein